MNKSMPTPNTEDPDNFDGEVQESMVERQAVSPNVPNLLRVSPMDTTTSTDVETSILDPVVKSDTFCRFVFLNKGILHSHSKITLGLNAPDANARYFSPNVGIHQLISRCALKIGTKTIQEIDGYNFLSAYKSMFVSNEHQKEREQVQSGRCIAHEFRYDDSTSIAGGTGNNTQSFFYGLSNGREYKSYETASFTARTPDLNVHQWADIKNEPVFQIALSELFPMLKQTQLPLYMMQEQVSVELHFEPVNVNRCQAQVDVTSVNYTINQDEVKLIADYIYYPQEMMTAYANANSTLTLNHFDYRHSKVSVSSTTDDGQTRIRNLGGAGRIVTKVITGLQPDLATSDLTVTNKFCSISPEQSYQFGQAPATTKFNGSLTVNLKYNDRFLYPIDVTNPSRQFHNTAQAEGMVPFVTREEFCSEGTALTSDKFMGRIQNTGDDADEVGILGRFNWLAYRLNRNERVNTRGIEYYYKYDGLGNGGNYTQRSWLELAKLTTISNGFATTTLL
jgi:hypothetical protein